MHSQVTSHGSDERSAELAVKRMGHWLNVLLKLQSEVTQSTADTENWTQNKVSFIKGEQARIKIKGNAFF